VLTTWCYPAPVAATTATGIGLGSAVTNRNWSVTMNTSILVNVDTFDDAIHGFGEEVAQ
jgi:hypothetical protein